MVVNINAVLAQTIEDEQLVSEKLRGENSLLKEGLASTIALILLGVKNNKCKEFSEEIVNLFELEKIKNEDGEVEAAIRVDINTYFDGLTDKVIVKNNEQLTKDGVFLTRIVHSLIFACGSLILFSAVIVLR